MNFKKIPLGINPPENIYVIIEIPTNSQSIKYEIEKKTGNLFVDRFIPTPLFFPFNYGFINHTLSLDNDPLDAIVITSYPIKTQSIILCRPIGILNMEDESGIDAKIIAVPDKKITNEYNSYQDITDLPKKLNKKIEFFFSNYKKLEKKKWVKIINWGCLEDAKKEILSSHKRAKKINKRNKKCLKFAK